MPVTFRFSLSRGTFRSVYRLCVARRYCTTDQTRFLIVLANTFVRSYSANCKSDGDNKNDNGTTDVVKRASPVVRRSSSARGSSNNVCTPNDFKQKNDYARCRHGQKSDYPGPPPARLAPIKIRIHRVFRPTTSVHCRLCEKKKIHDIYMYIHIYMVIVFGKWFTANYNFFFNHKNNFVVSGTFSVKFNVFRRARYPQSVKDPR